MTLPILIMGMNGINVMFPVNLKYGYNQWEQKLDYERHDKKF